MTGNNPWRNPPLQEAILEVRFPPVEDYTLFVAELTVRNRESFPTTQALPNANMPSNIIISGQVRHRFIGKNKDVIFQVGPDTLSINIIKYSGFDSFKDNISKILDALGEAINLEKIEKISLRYINRFSKIQNVFTVLNIVTPFPNHNTLKTKGIQLGFTVEENSDTYISTNIVFPVDNKDLILDINAFSVSKSTTNWGFESMLEWLNESHNLIYDNFEILVSEKEKEERK